MDQRWVRFWRCEFARIWLGERGLGLGGCLIVLLHDFHDAILGPNIGPNGVLIVLLHELHGSIFGSKIVPILEVSICEGLVGRHGRNTILGSKINPMRHLRNLL